MSKKFKRVLELLSVDEEQIKQMPQQEIIDKIQTFDYSYNYKYTLISSVSAYFTKNQIDNSILRTWMMNNQVVSKEKSFDKLNFENEVNQIEDIRDKFTLKLLLEYPVLRRQDYVNIKVKDYDEEVDNYYCDHKIVFNKLVKVPNKTTIEFRKEDFELVDTYITTCKNTLFDLNADWLCEKVKKMTTKYLGEAFNFQDLRTLYANKALSKCESPKEVLEVQQETAKSMNHSSSVNQKFYLKDTPIPKKDELSTVVLTIGGKKVKISGLNLKIEIL